MQHLAVFTGDIVRSTQMGAPALDEMFVALQKQCRAVADWPDADWPDSDTAFQRFRGDGWQMTLPSKYALRGAAVMRAAARATGKGHDTRIGIGIGQGQLQNGDLAAADGPAFVQAGHALDSLKRSTLRAAPEAPALLRITLPLLDQIASGWTPKQAQIAAALLAPLPPTQNALAQLHGTSRQLIQKQSDAAALPALIESCQIFEDADYP